MEDAAEGLEALPAGGAHVGGHGAVDDRVGAGGHAVEDGDQHVDVAAVRVSAVGVAHGGVGHKPD